MQKENLHFGHGSFVGEIMDSDFFELPAREQARIVGWAAGCPVVDKLTDPANTEPGRGPEAMVGRYAEVDFWFTFIAREVENLNPHLSYAFKQSEQRLEGEPVGEFESQSVSENFVTEIPPMETLVGYALPRLFVEQIGSHEHISREQRLERLERSLNILTSSVSEADSPQEILALLAEGMLKAGDVEPNKILSRILGTGWRKQHNGFTAVDDFKKVLSNRTPDVWAVYQKLTPEEKDQNKLV